MGRDPHVVDDCRVLRSVGIEAALESAPSPLIDRGGTYDAYVLATLRRTLAMVRASVPREDEQLQRHHERLQAEDCGVDDGDGVDRVQCQPA
jgi:hypothetical protein